MKQVRKIKKALVLLLVTVLLFCMAACAEASMEDNLIGTWSAGSDSMNFIKGGEYYDTYGKTGKWILQNEETIYLNLDGESPRTLGIVEFSNEKMILEIGSTQVEFTKTK